jgi:hypothetical protein
MRGAQPSAEMDFGMTDLEEKLNGADGEAVRNAVVKRLDGLLDQTTAEIRAGLAPGSYSRAEAVASALAAAREIMNAYFPNKADIAPRQES